MEIDRSNYCEIERLFTDLKNHISIKGVINGCLPGKIFSDKDRLSAVAITPQGIFLGGNLNNEGFLQDINNVIKQDILPAYRKRGQVDYVIFYPQYIDEEKVLNIMFDGLYPMKSTRMTFSKDICNVVNELPEDIFVVNKELLLNSDLHGLEGVIEEISGGWSSIDDFLERGFGCVAVKDCNIVGWCLTDWVIGNECEIGIETYSEYRRQGYGYKLACGILSIAKRKGMIRTGWQCWADNYGSIATAKSAGFELLSEFPVLFAWAEPLNNMIVNGTYYMTGRENLNIPPDYQRSAWCFSQALDKGWDWGGNPTLYWNCACMYYKSGQIELARHYYRLALGKGWNGIEQHIDNPYVYTNIDIEEILFKEND